MNALRLRGHTITHDWIRDIDRLGDDGQCSADDLDDCATNDLAGVVAADYFWLLVPTKGGSGCFVEMGHAMGKLGPSRLIFSGDSVRNLFQPYLARRGALIVDSHQDALEWICTDGKRRAEAS
jgi:hypothetical protein